MTRPHMEREDKRTLIFKVRLSAQEKKTLLELAASAGLSPSDFVRVQTVGSKPERRKATPERAILIKLQAELNKVGSNANQIARAYNRRTESDMLTGIDEAFLQETLQSIRTLTAHIAKELGHGD